MKEITIELTNYCPHNCKFCSSVATQYRDKAKFIEFGAVKGIVKGKRFDIIHISGGEPLSHPQFWDILQLCKSVAKDVVVHTNALTHIAFNVSAIDNIYVEAYLTVSPDVDKVRILKRIEHGKEKLRPEVHLSSNWKENCMCNHTIYMPDETTRPTPCRKDLDDKICQ